MKRRTRLSRISASLLVLSAVFIAAPAWADRYDDLVAEARELQKAGKNEEAIAHCDRVILTPAAPNNLVTSCRFLQGIAGYNIGRHDDVIASLKAVIQADPANNAYAAAYRYLSQSYGVTGRFDDGVHLANLAHEVYPREFVTFAMRATHLYSLGLYDEAIADIERYLRQIKSPTGEIRGYEVLFFSHLMKGDIQAAKVTLDKMKSIAGKEQKTMPDLFAPAAIEMIVGNVDRARAIYESGARLGVEIKTIVPDKKRPKKRKAKKTNTGVLVISVPQGSPAATAGIRSGDLILRYGEHFVDAAEDLQSLVWISEPNVEVNLLIEREGQQQTIVAVPAMIQFDEEIFLQDPRLKRHWRKQETKKAATRLWATGRRREALRLYAGFASQMMPDRETIQEIARYVRQLNPPPAVSADAHKLAREGEVLSLAAMGREDISSAIDQYREAVKLAPWWSDAHLNLGLLYEKRGDLILAANSLRNSLTLAGDSSDARAIEARIFEMEYRVRRSR